MLRRSSTTSTIYIYQPSLEHLLCCLGKGFGCLVIATHYVGQAGIRVNRDGTVGYLGESP